MSLRQPVLGVFAVAVAAAVGAGGPVSAQQDVTFGGSIWTGEKTKVKRLGEMTATLKLPDPLTKDPSVACFFAAARGMPLQGVPKAKLRWEVKGLVLIDPNGFEEIENIDFGAFETDDQGFHALFPAIDFLKFRDALPRDVLASSSRGIWQDALADGGEKFVQVTVRGKNGKKVSYTQLDCELRSTPGADAEQGGS